MKPISAYIHIPFCSHKCLFCSFAIAVAQTHRIDDYLKKIEDEAKAYQGRILHSLYLGGGTPSLLSQSQLTELMRIIRAHFVLTQDCEITIEANPEGIDEFKASLLVSLGFNRVSLGVQSLNEHYLKFLGRKHNSSQAKEAYTLLRKAGFDNISLDLMYAFPSQTSQELKEDVQAIASLGSQHLSLYSLSIEPNSRFYAQAIKLDEEEKLAQYYQDVVNDLHSYGFKQYEISNFAKEGYESTHNKNYWLGGEYIGLGMGAHGFEKGQRYWKKEKLNEYLTSSDVISGFEVLDKNTLRMEKVLFGLRMNQGIDVSLIPEDKRSMVDDFIRDGFLQKDGSTLKVTDKGRLVLDELSARLI